MDNAQQQIEKKARQLAYDTRYEVKKEIGGKKVDPNSMKRMLLTRLQKSSAAPNVKMRAKQMLLGEDYINGVKNSASDLVANTLYKVFVEGVSEDGPIELAYIKELNDSPERKYKVRVTDKKSGNSYVRYATREKITELRSNPNIQSVEITEYGEPREGEKEKGEETAAVKAGKDYDGDGKIESPAKEYRGSVHNAIQRKKGGTPDGKDTSNVKEAFITDAKDEDKKVTGKGINNYKSGKKSVVKLFPELETDVSRSGTIKSSFDYGESGYSKFLGMIHEREMTADEKEKEEKMKKKYDDSKMKEKMMKQYGPEKGEEVYFATIRKQAMGEEMECGSDDKKKQGEEEDPRSMKTKVNLVKNKLRAMGLKMSYEPEGEKIDEVAPLAIGAGMAAAAAAPYLLKKFAKPAVDKAIDKPATGSGGVIDKIKQRRDAINQMNSYQPEGDLVDEARRSEKEGKGSPESPLSYPGRAVQKERGEKGGRHWQSGGEGGSKTERGRKKSDKYSQAQRLRGLSNYPEKPGKYSEMQRKKRGGDIGSRFD
jgi:hypothetical protein